MPATTLAGARRIAHGALRHQRDEKDPTEVGALTAIVLQRYDGFSVHSRAYSFLFKGLLRSDSAVGALLQV